MAAPTSFIRRRSLASAGLWQVSGRSDLTYDQRVELDERYVRSWSIFRDIKILWQTASAGVALKGSSLEKSSQRVTAPDPRCYILLAAILYGGYKRSYPCVSTWLPSIADDSSSLYTACLITRIVRSFCIINIIADRPILLSFPT